MFGIIEINSIHNFSDFYQLLESSYKCQFKCDECNFRSRTKLSLESHIFNIHIRPFSEKEDSLNSPKCFKCNRIFKRRRILTNHLNSDCGIFPKFQCEHCPYKTKRKYNLKLHIRNCHKINLE